MLPLTHIIYFGLMGAAVVVLWEVQAFPGAQSSRDVGPALFPVWLALSMLALIVADLVVSRRRTARVPAGDVAIAAIFLLAMSGTVWAASQFGFFYVLPPALFAGLWLTGSRRPVANGLFSLALPALLWVLFDRILMIPIAEM